MQAAKTKEEQIEVRGARVHNLKNISVSLPVNKLTVITRLWFGQVVARL